MIDPASTSSRLFEQIRDRILEGQLTPGAKVTEAELAQRYGVNRAPLREALLRLEERRLIERIPFSGTRVFQPSEKMMGELYDIREMLEGLACRRAAEVITRKEVAELTQIAEESAVRLERERQLTTEGQPAIRDLHIRIAQISGNAELQRLLNGEIWHYMRASYWRLKRPIEVRLLGARQHEWIIEALAARDGELAEQLMRHHIRSNKETWKQMIGESGSGDEVSSHDR
jgi:DNA-binding GntR family transcriptional regulator